MDATFLGVRIGDRSACDTRETPSWRRAWWSRTESTSPCSSPWRCGRHRSRGSRVDRLLQPRWWRS